MTTLNTSNLCMMYMCKGTKDPLYNFCLVCENHLIEFTNEILDLSTDDLIDGISEMYDELESAPHYLQNEIHDWLKVYIREVNRRKSVGCEGCKYKVLNQQGHMGPGGCLYQEEDSVPSEDGTSDAK